MQISWLWYKILKVSPVTFSFITSTILEILLQIFPIKTDFLKISNWCNDMRSTYVFCNTLLDLSHRNHICSFPLSLLSKIQDSHIGNSYRMRTDNDRNFLSQCNRPKGKAQVKLYILTALFIIETILLTCNLSKKKTKSW